jgi:chromosome partitioning protein
MMAADQQIAKDAEQLSVQLGELRARLFPPSSLKVMRSFTSGEAAKLIGVSDGYLRQLALSGDGPSPATDDRGRRSYTLADINALRSHLASQHEPGSTKARSYVRHRDPERGEHCQVIAVTNFKGGSGKTTTSTHLAQYLAIRGYRVLAVDLDPQASLSSLFGYQPELDLTGNDTIYGAIRYDAERVPLDQVIRKTYVDGLDLVPGNLELQEFEHTTPQYLASRPAGSDPQELFFARVQTALKSVGRQLRRRGARLPAAARLPHPWRSVCGQLGHRNRAPADARCGVHEPVSVHDVGSSVCGQGSWWHAQFRFLALSGHPVRASGWPADPDRRVLACAVW